MSRLIKVDVNQETVNMIEGLHYEVNSRKEIIQLMLTKPDPGFNKELFDAYNKEYAEFYAQYDRAKNELQSRYVPEDLIAKNATWSLDFNSCVLTITVPDEVNCNCCKGCESVEKQ